MLTARSAPENSRNLRSDNPLASYVLEQAKRRSENVIGIALAIGMHSTYVNVQKCQTPFERSVLIKPNREGATGPMPTNKYTIVQIGVICFLIAIIGVRLVSQYPEWFNGEARKKLHTSTTQSAEPYERVLKAEPAR